MVKVRFSGHVLPTHCALTIASRPIFNWAVDELQLNVRFTLMIERGTVAIDCELSSFERTHFWALFIRAYDIARAAVDSAAFRNGQGLVLVLDAFTDDTGATTAIGLQQQSLSSIASAVTQEKDFERVLEIILAEPPLFLALRELSESLLTPQRAAVHCARAIFHLRVYFGSPGSAPADKFRILREKLQISKTYLEGLLSASRASLRGVEQGSSAMEAMFRAWVVVNRFLEYRKRGGQPLPLSEFPLLS